MKTHAPMADKTVKLKNRLFESLAPHEVVELLALARNRQVETDEIIFEKGDPGDCLYTIVKGRVGITTTSADGKEIVLNILGAGEVFGEIALLDGKQRTAGAIAMASTTLLRVERADFLSFLERHPKLFVVLITVLCERIRWISNIIEDTIFLDIPHRLGKRLLSLAVQYGNPTIDGVRIDMKLSQEKLGQMLGVTRESINKGIRLLEHEGIISNDDGFIILKDIDGLKTFLRGSIEY